MKKNLKRSLLVGILVCCLSLPYLALAQIQTSNDNNPLNKLNAVGSGVYAPATETSLASMVGTIVQAVLGLLGIVFVVLIILAGFKWMNAGGNEKDVEDAQARIKTAIIGLVITVSAYAIYAFVWSFLIKA
jgi:hypothetical protein